MRHIYAFLCISLLCFNAQASICEDLYSVTCNGEHKPDGTSLGIKPEIVNNPTRAIFEKIQKDSQPKFFNLLKDRKNEYFKQLLISAADTDIQSKCTSPEQQSSEECLKALADYGSELMALRLMGVGSSYDSFIPDDRLNDVINIIDSGVFRKLENETSKEINAYMSQDNIDKKIDEQILPRVQNIAKQKLDAMAIDPQVKSYMMSKIDAIRFAGSNCDDLSDKDIPDLPYIILPDAIYNGATNMLQVCSGLTLESDSEFHLVFTVAHEVSHSFDPCFVQLGPRTTAFKYTQGQSSEEAEEEYPIPGVLKCLRSTRSIGATKGELEDFFIPFYSEDDPVLEDQSNAVENFFCGGNDQIGESFADWFAAQVVPAYIKEYHSGLSLEQRRNGYANIWKSGCESEMPTEEGVTDEGATEVKFEVHPATNMRTNRILLADPDIRNQMNCPSRIEGLIHCTTIKNPVPSSEDAKTRKTGIIR